MRLIIASLVCGSLVFGWQPAQAMKGRKAKSPRLAVKHATQRLLSEAERFAKAPAQLDELAQGEDLIALAELLEAHSKSAGEQPAMPILRLGTYTHMPVRSRIGNGVVWPRRGDVFLTFEHKRKGDPRLDVGPKWFLQFPVRLDEYVSVPHLGVSPHPMTLLLPFTAAHAEHYEIDIANVEGAIPLALERSTDKKNLLWEYAYDIRE